MIIKPLLALILPLIIIWLGGWLIHLAPDTAWPEVPLIFTTLVAFGVSIWWIFYSWAKYREWKEEKEREERHQRALRRHNEERDAIQAKHEAYLKQRKGT